MDTFAGKVAVITGAGTGMGRELALQLAAAGSHLALCDVQPDELAATAEQCQAVDPSLTVSTSVVDVTDEASLERFAGETTQAHGRDHVHLLFNNAGIGGTPSFLDPETRDIWERTFDICWRGVYLTSRVFLPLVVAADEGHVVNTSSINGMWASLGPSRTHTAYAAAKFAVRGFTEALITDLRLNAPHVGCSVVMPGHIGTDIVANSRQMLDHPMDAEATEAANVFRNTAPTTAETAATEILDGVLEGRWRILIGEDAHLLDGLLRDRPEEAYEQSFVDRLHGLGVLTGLVG